MGAYKDKNGTWYRTLDSEFALSKREYRFYTGKDERNNIIAYQVRQSFKPGEVTPEEANQIGYDFASRFLKGKHAFVVCTHTDKAHIHNHIICAPIGGRVNPLSKRQA